ncbi:Scr1 family TA system antitoxin-like transcriptional regulator [Thermomonospora cellulosilytica]|uniref:Transcriptional regulator with XRE-family HTH domain n=1 Tax=Thermomonospora cellulosilytica TaxID=1411118 RepID=A0A7W3MVW4_9ACTN|nr:Scr1 family TA system antitoxin-like transcriptional regulator [Thermomonospora cellulosilytica]MBA9002853.1 transcriptional regulator with XRE-family HTH domain [Thermomonospora cellulosilytica]
MPSSPSSSAQAARELLGAKLRALRESHGISGRAFAERAGWKAPSSVTMIEKGQRTITARHVELWCSICQVPEQQRRRLLAEQAQVAGMWVPYAQLNRGGLEAAQKSVRRLYEELTVARSYQPKVIPGMGQTEAYTRAALTGVLVEQQVDSAEPEEEIEAAVAERMDRQRLLARPDARWFFLLEEPVLWFRPYSARLHREQLLHLLELRRRPNVFVGIIPVGADRRGVHPEEAFDITDDRLVTVELVSGYLSVTQPEEVALYMATWERLWALAATGTAATALIRSALDRLKEGQAGV